MSNGSKAMGQDRTGLLIRATRIGAAIAFSLSAVQATATPGSGFAPSPIVNGHFGTLNVNTADNKTDKWGMALKTLDDTVIGADRLTVQPGGYSGWHAHPSPVFITVTQGTIEWYDAALCVAHSHTANTPSASFIEPAYGPHDVRNPGATVAEYVAITLKPEGFIGPAFRLNRDEPSSC